MLKFTNSMNKISEFAFHVPSLAQPHSTFAIIVKVRRNPKKRNKNHDLFVANSNLNKSESSDMPNGNGPGIVRSNKDYANLSGEHSTTVAKEIHV